MENQEIKKPASKTPFIVVIVILVLIIAGLTGYIIYERTNTTITETNTEEKTNEEETETNEEETETNEEESTIKEYTVDELTELNKKSETSNEAEKLKGETIIVRGIMCDRYSSGFNLCSFKDGDYFNLFYVDASDEQLEYLDNKILNLNTEDPAITAEVKITDVYNDDTASPNGYQFEVIKFISISSN